MARPGWTRESLANRGKCSQRWRHESGWVVSHCGHPTANYPYFASHEARGLTMVVSHSGRGFSTLEQAFDQIEALVAGTAVLDHGQGNTRYGARRIRLDGDADWVPEDAPAREEVARG